MFQNLLLPTMHEDETEMVREAMLNSRGGENPQMYRECTLSLQTPFWLLYLIIGGQMSWQIIHDKMILCHFEKKNWVYAGNISAGNAMACSNCSSVFQRKQVEVLWSIRVLTSTFVIFTFWDILLYVIFIFYLSGCPNGHPYVIGDVSVVAFFYVAWK